jgi:cellulose synthase/poly-beta-1,6-N-acetylglucosamine synthase-like glycosyltransferase
MFDGIDKERIGRLFTVFVFLTLSVTGFGFAVYLFFVAHSIMLYAIAVIFLMLSIGAGFFNVLASYWYYRSFEYNRYVENFRKNLKPVKDYPTVSVVMPTHTESIHEIKKNLIELKKINYQKGKMHIFVLNDSENLEMKKNLEGICNKLHVKFINKENNIGYKAGSLNNFLKHSKDEFVAIFDADEYLEDKNFLVDTIPFFQDEKIAYVQTEKRYRKGTFFSDSVDIFDAFFFRFIETSRSMDNTAIFSGSCGVIRRSVIDEVGGFPEVMIEDTFFSLESDLKGYRGFYLPKVYARGEPITTFTGLVKQQWRYNYGDTQFIAYFLKKKDKKKKHWFQRVNYTAHGFGLNYLSLGLILFTLISLLIVFSSLPFAHINVSSISSLFKISGIEIAELLGLFAFLLSMFVPAILTKMYFKSFKKGVMVFLLNYALAFVRAKAAIAAMVGSTKRPSWGNKSGYNNNIISAIGNTKTEMAFTGILVLLGIVALSRSNIAGGIWLIWYAGMYSLATLFFYKYK